MSANNRHVIEISGATLREISERALAILDEFFAREIDWEVTSFISHCEVVTMKNGAGVVVGEQVVDWKAAIEAEAKGLHIGTRNQKPAMLFSL